MLLQCAVVTIVATGAGDATLRRLLSIDHSSNVRGDVIMSVVTVLPVAMGIDDVTCIGCYYSRPYKMLHRQP
jgi:hypothetical protein